MTGQELPRGGGRSRRSSTEKPSVTDYDVVQNSLLRFFKDDPFKAKPGNLVDALSSYGSTSGREAFAEAFAEAYTCKEPGEFSKIFKEELEKVIGGAERKAGVKSVANTVSDDIIEMERKLSDTREGFKFINDKTFDDLTIPARKKGAVIIRGTEEAEEHLAKVGAAASNIGDVLVFRKDVCISEVLEETHHFEQNLNKMNNDKPEPLRSVLNEIDAKQYLLDNAEKYKIPRNEIELTKKQLMSYQKQLKEIMEE